MKKRCIYIAVGLIVTLSLVLLLNTSERVYFQKSAHAAAHWWDKLGEPEYGGTLTFLAV